MERETYRGEEWISSPGEGLSGKTGRGGLRGEVTVFLALTLIIMISVLFTVIDGARSNASAYMTECVADMGLQSSLAEYSRGLLEQYDLFFVDAGYGTGESGYILLENHIKGYMQENFEIEGISLTGMIRDLLGMSAGDVAVLKASGAADGKGQVVERAAVDYMLDIANMYDSSKLSSYEALSETLPEDYKGSEEVFDEVNDELSEFGDENPADNVNKIRNSSSRILKKVTEGMEISGVGIDPKVYVSGRGAKERDGFICGEKAPNAAEDLLFQKYLMMKCGNYTKNKEGSLLKYQMEYVLKGKDNDHDNLKSVVNSLVLMREASNFPYIMGDAKMGEQAELVALACSILLLDPELLDVIKTAILLAWSYAESLNDVRILLKGGKVPVAKNSDSWQMGLLDALSLNLHGDGSDSGLSYEEYLHILLAVLDKDKRNMRFMDIVEMDMRMIPGNEGFCMDNCLSAYTALMMTDSTKGNSNMITRLASFSK